MKPFEIIEVHSLEVACDGLPTPERNSGFAQAGSGGALGHPRVFLHIEPDTGEVTCPYCSRSFVLNAPKQASGH